MSLNSPLLELVELKRHFGGTVAASKATKNGPIRAVDGVNLKIENGTTLALVGESGCGKTTLTRLILRLDKVTAGEVRLDGQDVHAFRGKSLRQFRSDVQAVFQDPWGSLNPRMRVRDIVAEPLVATQRLARAEVDRRVAEMLETV